MSTSFKIMLVALISFSANTLKDIYFLLGGNLGNLPNQRIPKVATDIILHLNMWYLVNSSDLWGVTTNIMFPLSYLGSIDHHIRNILDHSRENCQHCVSPLLFMYIIISSLCIPSYKEQIINSDRNRNIYSNWGVNT